MLKNTILATAAAIALASGGAYAAAHVQPVAQTMDVAGATILADANGMSLYTFDKDADGVSNCNGGCAEKWPPLMANDDSTGQGDFSVLARADGSMQWAYKGDALYTWVNDKVAGDITGDGVNGVWHLAKP